MDRKILQQCRKSLRQQRFSALLQDFSVHLAVQKNPAAVQKISASAFDPGCCSVVLQLLAYFEKHLTPGKHGRVPAEKIR